jgi:hypothetical protein
VKRVDFVQCTSARVLALLPSCLPYDRNSAILAEISFKDRRIDFAGGLSATCRRILPQMQDIMGPLGGAARKTPPVLVLPCVTR